MRIAAALFVCACALVLAAPAAQAQTPVPTACPATFDVLAADTIGTYAVPSGAYRITVLNPSGLSCASASDLLRQFLEDFNPAHIRQVIIQQNTTWKQALTLTDRQGLLSQSDFCEGVCEIFRLSENPA